MSKTKQKRPQTRKLAMPMNLAARVWAPPRHFRVNRSLSPMLSLRFRNWPKIIYLGTIVKGPLSSKPVLQAFACFEGAKSELDQTTADELFFMWQLLLTKAILAR
jgi:hypothetical protein